MNESATLETAVRDGVARAAAVVGLAGVGLIHLLDISGKFQETPYMAWMYVALIAGCVVTAGALLHGSDPRTWALAALLPLGAIVGYTLTRTVGLPQATDDIGNWGEPLGMASLFVEGLVVTLSGLVLRERARALARRPAIRATAAGA